VHALSSSPAEERTKEQGAAPVVQPAEEPEVSENDGSSFAGALSEVEARVEVAKATKGAVVGEKRATTRRSTPRKAPPAPAAKQAADAGAAAVGPVRPTTLAIDIGGTGLKASVLDADGKLVADRVRVATPHPCPTKALIDALATLIAPLPSFGRVSVGFPGVVRKGVVLTAPHLVARHGTPKSPPVPKLVAEWAGFDLETALSERFGRPVRVINDADLQGLDVVSGSGLEFVVTLGTGVGTALFLDGRLAPHLELSHHPFRKGETYDEQLGDATLRRIGFKKWQKRLEEALGNFQRLINYDRLYIGGGNARLLVGHLDPSVTIVDNLAGILGGIKLWELPHH
jgi:polyphosphate glucokinase